MNEIFEFLIIGAGPAGLQLGYFMEKNERNYLILERSDGPGAFFRNNPRHRKLISINKVYTGTDNPNAQFRWDWNSLITDNEDLLFKNYSKEYFPHPDALVKYCEDYAAHYDLNIRFNTNVSKVSKNDGLFTVETMDGKKFQGKRLIVATGLFKPFIPDIPGVGFCENYMDHDIDPEKYINKRVLVVGKGNSAFETADNLIETTAAIHILSPESVKMAWQTHFVGNLRAVNNNFLDTYQLKSQNTIIDAEIDTIEKVNGKFKVHITYSHAKGQTAVIEYDKVIFCTGFKFDDSYFDDTCRPELTIYDKFPNQTLEWESTNISDLYFAGTIMQACDYKKTMSGFIHGFRHNVESLFNILESKYYGTPHPHEHFPLNAESVLQVIIRQVNESPGMFLQPGFLCDVIVNDHSTCEASLYKDIRKDYVLNSWIAEEEDYFMVTLEYGHFAEDPFNVSRDPAPDMGHEAAYLHPVIRRFNKTTQIAEYHINDDLESAWYKDIYFKPALAFMEEQLVVTNTPDKINI